MLKSQPHNEKANPMKKIIPVIAILFCAAASYAKPTPDAALEILMKGNARFVSGKSTHPRNTPARRQLSAVKNQGDYAYATVLGCSDSRVPVELIFDAGIMDLFVIRVPGNVFQTDEIAGAEYGVGHVHTPVLMVLGHTDCGAVTATVAMTDKHGHAHKLERNIPALLKPIIPAVAEARKIARISKEKLSSNTHPNSMSSGKSGSSFSAVLPSVLRSRPERSK